MAGANRNTSKSNSTIPKSGYGFLEALLNTLKGHSTKLTAELEKNHKTRGRKGYPAEGMLCAVALRFLLNERYAGYFLAALDDNPRLLSLCGLDRAPSEPTYSRFKKKLAGYPDQLAEIFNQVAEECVGEIERLRDAGVVPEDAPRLGEMLALDPTDIEVYAKPRGEHCDNPEIGKCSKRHRSHCNSTIPGEGSRPNHKPCTDPDARWGYRTPKGKSGNTSGKKGEDPKEWFHGYKAHVVADTHYQIPLHLALRPANENENPKFAEDLDKALQRHPWLKPKFVMADKGYDATPNFEHTVERGAIPMIAVRRPQKDKETGKRRFDGTYNEDGRPVCVGEKPMTWLGTGPDGAHHFRCQSGGCWLRDKIDWSRYCDSQHSEKPEGNLLRIMGIVPRFSKSWKSLYKKRTGIERFFSSDKRSWLMDTHRNLKQAKIDLHVNMSALAYLLTALTHLKADDYKHMRQMLIRLPRRAKEAAEPSGIG